MTVKAPAEQGFSLEEGRPKQAIWFLRQTKNFRVGFESRPIIFMWVLEAYPRFSSVF